MPLWMLLLACASSPTAPVDEGGGGLPDGALVTEVSAGGTVATVTKAPTGTVLEVRSSERHWRVGAGDPDRVTLSADGAHVAWVQSLDGLPALHVAATTEGVPRPLTNVGLERRKGAPPLGFVPPPVREGDLRFDGDWLRWQAEGRAWEVRWSSH